MSEGKTFAWRTPKPKRLGVIVLLHAKAVVKCVTFKEIRSQLPPTRWISLTYHTCRMDNSVCKHNKRGITHNWLLSDLSFLHYHHIIDSRKNSILSICLYIWETVWAMPCFTFLCHPTSVQPGLSHRTLNPVNESRPLFQAFFILIPATSPWWNATGMPATATWH